MENISASPDEMREAVAFSFDNNVGLDIFDQEAEQVIRAVIVMGGHIIYRCFTTFLCYKQDIITFSI
jgi:hypothetical protein